METNSPADTDQSLPPDDVAPVEQVEVPATTDPAAEQQAAALAGVPEPMPELASAEPEPPIAEPAEPLEELNVSEESAAEEIPAAADTIEERDSNSSEEGAVDADATGSADSPEQVPPEGAAGEQTSDPDPLNALADQSQRARLSQPDEHRATTLLKEALLDGRAGVTRAVAILPKLPWVIGVAAVSAVWKDMKAAFRTQLLSGLAKTETDAARRMRLSLARGLFKVDVPTALKLMVAVAKEMRDKETGALTPKSAQIFANVLIGRAKPWIGQVSLHDLKPAEADLLVHCALVSSFSVPHAPVTQLGVIKWAAEAGRLVKLHELATESATRGLGRWSAKWQGALRKEVEELPEAFAGALKAPAPQERERQERAPQQKQERPAPEAAPPVEDAPRDDAAEDDEDGDNDDNEDEDDLDDEDDEDEEERKERRGEPGSRQQGGQREQSKPRPVYESKTIPRKDQPQPQQQAQQQRAQQPQGKQGGGVFDLRDTLRQIEQHVAGLRSELVSTQNKLRQREQDSSKSKRAPERSAAPIIPGEPTPDELARLNLQLESRNAELQQRIVELTQDSEDRAASMGRHGSEPVEQPDAQLRTLLSLKLQEDYEDFAALEKEKPDLVVQQHYRTVLRHVLDVLRNEGVQFQQRAGE